MKTIIIEDVPSDLLITKHYLAEYFPQVKVVAEAGLIAEAIPIIIKEKPQLLIMDIEIIDGTSYDLLDQLQKAGVVIDFEIIFMTGHLKFEYATRGFSYSAIDFLAKPIDLKLFTKAVQKAIDHHRPLENVKQIQLLLDILRSEGTASQLAVPLIGGSGTIQFVNINEILYLKADDTITIFHLENKVMLRSNKPLGHFVQFLQNDPRFSSVSNSLFVNSQQVLRFCSQDQTLTMRNGDQLKMSRRVGQDFKKNINQSPKSAENESALLRFLKSIFRR